MQNRLRAGDYFTPQRDYLCLAFYFAKTEEINWHCHEYYEIELVTKGSIVDVINGSRYDLNMGDFILLKPDDFHGIQLTDPESEFVNIAFTESLFQEVATFFELSTLNEALPLIGHLPTEPRRSVADKVKQMLNPRKPLMKERTLVKSWISLCLFYGKILKETDDDEQLPSWLGQLLKKMKTPEGFIGGLEYLKQSSDYSYPHICRSFQKYLHITPVEWINEQRLIYSGYLLIQTDQTVLDIAFACGFRNLSHFNHLFKEMYGISPSRYRATYRKDYLII